MMDLQYLIAKLRSLMLIRKSKGPKTDHLGTSHLIVDISESNPLIETNCVRSER